MMSAFNTSTRREDLSVRLKAQNIRNAKEQTRQLEEESRKMEDRLRELKMAMSREKEQREQQGGFWRTGQSGNLHHYAKDVLDSKPPKQIRNKSGGPKVKVLKDEPISVPQRSKAPGTVAYIASKKVSPKDKRKGPQCGQCEGRVASVTCAQCGEDYCAGCFAAFHLKGALKKHRSVPIQANTPRHCHTPRLTPPASSRDLVTSHLPAEGDAVALLNEALQGVNRNSPEGASGSFDGPSLLTGNYDENGSAASFQEALRAWRVGEDGQTSTTTSVKQRVRQRSSSQSTNSISKASTRPSVESVEHSTSTTEAVDRPVSVTFNEHGISYAERLLLKKHRSTDLDELPCTSASDVWYGQGDNPSLSQTGRNSFYDQDGHLDTQSGHVNFQTLYDAVRGSSVQSRAGAESEISIIELPDGPFLLPMNGLETPGRCHIEEVDNAPGDSFLHGATKPASSRIAFTEECVDAQRTGIPPFDKRVPLRGLNSDRISTRTPTSGRKHKGSKSAKVPYVTEPDWEPTPSVMRQLDTDNCSEGAAVCENTEGPTQAPGSRGTTKRPSTGKSRPQSRARPKSGARPRSRAGSRAGSRMASRTSMYGEGLLTKTPSSALQAVAQLELSPHDRAPPDAASLSGFFLAGVNTVTKDREITPSSAKSKAKDGPYKISNRLYQMAPRSWRPDTSLGETVPTGQVRGTESVDEEMTLSYTYSGQVSGSPVQVGLHTTPVVSASDAINFSVRPPSQPRSRTSSARSHRISSPKVLRGNLQSSQALTDEAGCGRTSRAVVMDGEDLSQYDVDSVAVLVEQDQDDGETLHQLEWELASETGRITEDGKLSRLDMLIPDEMSDDLATEELTDRLSKLTTPGPGYDIDAQLREDEMMDGFEDEENRLLTDEEAVKRLL